MSNSNIGTFDDAITAVLIHEYVTADDNGYVYLSGDVQDYAPGWVFLGSGVHRFAYRSPDGLVYKVPCKRDSRYFNAQEAEASAARILSQEDAPEGFGVPEVNIFYVEDVPVIVMPDYGDVGEYLDIDEQIAAERFYRNRDIHQGNIRRFGGMLIMIDLGFFKENAGGVSVAACSCCV